MKPDIFFISLGCPRNLVDSEVLIGKLKEQGFRVFYEMAKGSVAIVNTCGFIEDAKKEAIDILTELAAFKKSGKIKCLIATGCLVQRYSKELTRDIKEIDAVFGTSDFGLIPEYIEEITKGKKLMRVNKEPSFLYDHSMPRTLLTPAHYVYVKIQEGCLNFCSYCAIPKIRGPYRSREIESVLGEIKSFRDQGAREINIIGQDTTLYGKDRYGRNMLHALLKKAAKIMKGRWIRLLYTHPAHYNEKLINVIKEESAICSYLDLPVQHISDKILKRMNRKTTKKEIVALIKKLRKKISGVAIRTSLLVGFPGETGKDFRELEDFVKETKFDRLGAFTYSREDGTPAYKFSRQIPEEEKDERLKRIMEIQQSVSEDNNKRFLGKTLKVLIDEKSESAPDQYVGRTEYDAPEVDGTVYVTSKEVIKNGDFVRVKIEDTLEYDLVGRKE